MQNECKWEVKPLNGYLRQNIHQSLLRACIQSFSLPGPTSTAMYSRAPPPPCGHPGSDARACAPGNNRDFLTSAYDHHGAIATGWLSATIAESDKDLAKINLHGNIGKHLRR